MLDYDVEAESYDASRGGEARAEAAAEAVERLLPPGARVLLDVACGTGIVTRRLRRDGRAVLGVDRSKGMAALAAERLPGRVVLGDAARLPVADGRVDAVVLVWLLHLLDDAEPVVAEAARVLGAGGVLVATVDRDAGGPPGEVAELTAPMRRRFAPDASDGFGRVRDAAARHGLRFAGETGFRGIGQGRTPRQWRELVLSGRMRWTRDARPEAVTELCRELAELPGQDVVRPEPHYRLVAFRKPGLPPGGFRRP